jgi:hypothetical protein
MKVHQYFIVTLLVIFLILSFSMNYSYTNASSLSNTISGADDFIKTGTSNEKIGKDNLKGLSDSIFNVLLIIGTIIAMIVGIVLGIQFITGSVEQKSKVKESLIPYFVGCGVIFGAFGIWKLVVTILSSIT